MAQFPIFTGFSERARGISPITDEQSYVPSQLPDPQVAEKVDGPPPVNSTFSKDLFATVIAAVVIVILAVLAGMYFTNQKSSDELSDFGPGYSYDRYQFGIHVNSDGVIDQRYSEYELSPLTTDQIEKLDIIMFRYDDSRVTASREFGTSSVIYVDEEPYAVNSSIVASFDSSNAAVDAYNTLLAEDPSINIGNIRVASVKYASFGTYVMTLLESKIDEALTLGDITGPDVTSLGYGSEYFDDEVAAAYKAGVDGDYDFGCMYLEIQYNDWDEYAAQVAETIGYPELSIYNNSDEYVVVNTELPCDYLQAEPSDPSSEEA